MGDVSIIARRLPSGVQYGWSGNGGYYRMVGARLNAWYQDSDDVDYLFGLGQTSLIGKKGSEHGGINTFETHHLTNEPFWEGKTEREIFSRIAFVDYGYFYDLDNQWYYIVPGPFRIKIPFSLIEHCLESARYEFDYLALIQKIIVKYIFTEYKESDADFADFLKQQGYDDTESIKNELEDARHPVYEMFNKYHRIFDYFDDWVLIVADDSGNEIEQIIMKKETGEHVETNKWLADTHKKEVHNKCTVAKKLTDTSESKHYAEEVEQGESNFVEVVLRLNSGETKEKLIASGFRETTIEKALMLLSQFQ